MRVNGSNHVTIGVADLPASLEFSQGALGMAVAHRGDHEASLEWGAAWVCPIERGPTASPPQPSGPGLAHVAFSIADGDFDRAVELLRSAGERIVRGPERLGQGRRVTARDPDGMRIELHTVNLADPLAAWS